MNPSKRSSNLYDHEKGDTARGQKIESTYDSTRPKLW